MRTGVTLILGLYVHSEMENWKNFSSQWVHISFSLKKKKAGGGGRVLDLAQPVDSRLIPLWATSPPARLGLDRKGGMCTVTKL